MEYDLHYDSFNPTGSKRSTCKTVSGPIAGLPCVFPFKLYGNVFHGCTSHRTNRPWCNTRVNNLTGRGYLDKWGFCHEDCPRVDTTISGIEIYDQV